MHASSKYYSFTTVVVYATYMIGQTLLLYIKVQNCQDITNVSETCTYVQE